MSNNPAVEKTLPLLPVTIRYRRPLTGQLCFMTVLASSAAGAKEAVRESETSRGHHAVIEGDADAYDGPRYEMGDASAES